MLLGLRCVLPVVSHRCRIRCRLRSAGRQKPAVPVQGRLLRGRHPNRGIRGAVRRRPQIQHRDVWSSSSCCLGPRLSCSALTAPQPSPALTGWLSQPDCGCRSYSVAFPELSFPAEMRLKKFAKETKVGQFRKHAQQAASLISKNSLWVQGRAPRRRCDECTARRGRSPLVHSQG